MKCIMFDCVYRVMSMLKRKANMDPPSVDNEVHKQKAVQDLKTTEHFIQVCLNQVYKGEQSGTTLTKKGWKAIISQFNEISGRNYNKLQLKNKWDSLKKDLLVWHKLFGKEIGLGGIM